MENGATDETRSNEKRISRISNYNLYALCYVNYLRIGGYRERYKVDFYNHKSSSSFAASITPLLFFFLRSLVFYFLFSDFFFNDSVSFLFFRFPCDSLRRSSGEWMLVQSLWITRGTCCTYFAGIVIYGNQLHLNVLYLIQDWIKNQLRDRK